MQIPKASRGTADVRTIGSMMLNHKKIVQAGAILSQAKMFENCPRKPMFHWGTDQVLISKFHNPPP